MNRRYPLSVIFFFLILGLAQGQDAASTKEKEYKELVTQADALAQKGNYAKAAELAEKALKIQEALGQERVETADALLNLAGYYHLLRKSAAAEPLLLRALAINEKSRGPEDEKCARVLNQLGLVSVGLGKYVTAGNHYKRAIAIQEKSLGKDNPRLATTLNNLGNMYLQLGMYSQSEGYLLRAINIFEKAPASFQFNQTLTLNNLAGLYSRVGKVEKALEAIDKALPVLEKNLPKEHPMLATAVTNRGGFLLLLGDIPQSEKEFQKGKAIRAKILPPDHPDLANSLVNLGKIAFAKNEFNQAETDLQSALAIYEKAYTNGHPVSQVARKNLAYTWSVQGKTDQARKELLSIAEEQEKNFGPDFPDLALVRKNLGDLFFQTGETKEALSWHLRAATQMILEMQRSAPLLNPREQVELAALNRSFLNKLLSHTQPGQETSIYEQVLRWKGMVFYRRKLLLALGADENLRNKLIQSTRTLQNAYGQNPAKTQLGEYALRIKKAREILEAAEKELAAKIPETTLGQSLETILTYLPNDAAALDFLRFSQACLDTDSKTLRFSDSYAVFLLRKGKPVVRVNLEGAKEIDALIADWRLSLDKRVKPVEGAADPAAKLRDKVWLPLAKELHGVKTVFISPDGPMATLPFAALPGDNPEKYLLEEYRISTIPFLQALPGLNAPAGFGAKGLLAMGDISFGAMEGKKVEEPRGGSIGRWKNLPGTREEVDAIEVLFRSRFQKLPCVKLAGPLATEEEFRLAAANGRFVHLATHGFFASEKSTSLAAVVPPGLLRGERGRLLGNDPGVLSGLVLAHANLPTPEQPFRGILTANDVGLLNLREVELAVLSGCETGLGKTAGGEGLLGLQRGFQLAGARSVVASLWKVSDLSTREIMIRFYDNLWTKKMSKLDALREAQIWALEQGRKSGLTRGVEDEPVVVKDPSMGKSGRLPPRFWAAWILSGDWN